MMSMLTGVVTDTATPAVAEENMAMVPPEDTTVDTAEVEDMAEDTTEECPDVMDTEETAGATGLETGTTGAL